jgi:ATP-dependent helicase HrpA
VLADERVLFDFFDARVPADVSGGRSFENWLSGLPADERELLYLGHDVLMRDDAGAAPGELFPDHLDIAGRRYPLEYHFEPGHPEDGVSLTVPLELLNVLDPGRLQWLVPGLLRDKLVALIRQLPKPARRSLTPVPQFADALTDALSGRENEPMLEACAVELRRMTGLQIGSKDLDESRIDDHFRFLVCVTGKDGRLIERSRDLAGLQARLGRKAQRRFMDRQGAGFNRDGETEWTFGRLDTRITTSAGATAFPAVVDQEKAVGLRLFDTWEEAAIAHHDGVMRLLRLQLADKVSWLHKHSGIDHAARMAWAATGSPAELVADLVSRSLEDAAGDLSRVRDETAFESLCRSVRSSAGLAMQSAAAVLNESLKLYGNVAADVYGRLEDSRPEAFEDISTQLEDLMYPGFVSQLSPGRLEHYPRYLKALQERLRQLAVDPQRDAKRLQMVRPWWQKYLGALEAGKSYDEALDRFRWLIEEYRVSLFAQRLKTAEKVSEKRLADAWQDAGN